METGSSTDSTTAVKLGEGTNGEVYTYNSIYEELRLIKLLKRKPAANIAAAVKFGRPFDVDFALASNTTEYNLLNLLAHPRIVPLYGMVRWTNPPVDVDSMGLVLPRALGDLYAVVELNTEEVEAGPLVEGSVPLIIDVALALEHLHLNDYIHRDLKASNALVFEEATLTGRPEDTRLIATLADFGSVYNLRNPPALLRRSQCTYIYSAPEALFTNYYGKPADVWSLGVMIIELLTGWAPKVYTEDQPQDWRFFFPVGIYASLPQVLTRVPTVEELRAVGAKDYYEPNPNIIYDDGCEPPAPTHPFTELSTDHWLQFRSPLRMVLGRAGIDLLESIFQLDPAARPTITEVLDHSAFRTFSQYIRALRAQATVVNEVTVDQLAPYNTNSTLTKLHATFKDLYQSQPEWQQNPVFRFVIVQSLVLLARFSAMWTPDPELDQKAQYAALVGAGLNTICNYYQIDDLYTYGRVVGGSYKLLEEPPYREYAVKLSYQLLAAFPKGDLVAGLDVDALLQGWHTEA